MIQVAPEVTRQAMNKMPHASPRTRPAPVSDAVPSLAIEPPYTVNTSWMAETKPLKLEIADDGSAMRIPMTGRLYRMTEPIADRKIANGTSRCGLIISSPALFGSSKPT